MCSSMELVLGHQQMKSITGRVCTKLRQVRVRRALANEDTFEMMIREGVSRLLR